MVVTLHSVVREGLELDYDREHRLVPDDLVDDLARAGITEWVIWRVGRHLFHRVECEDWQRANEALAGSAANQRWQHHINQVVDHFDPVDEHGVPQPLDQVWSLSGQRDG